MVESKAVPGFLPSTHGLHFANRFPPGPTLTFGPIDPRWIGIGDAAAGLCGGMSWYVRERFEAGSAIPTDPVAPANGSPLFATLVRRQVLSLDWFRTPFKFWRMGMLSPVEALRRTREREWPRIRADIAAGRLSMVGLVRHQGLSPWAMTESHQVLAYAYDIDGDNVTLKVYDPNWPGRDDVTMLASATTVTQSTSEPMVGLLRLP